MQEQREAFWLAVREKMEGFLLPDCWRIADKPEARDRGGSVKRCVNASGGGLLAARSHSIDVLHSCEDLLQQLG
jgi:hypothetical protein